MIKYIWVMNFDFKSEMVKRNDEELIQILTVDRDNYLPEALAAAKDEFEKRNLQNEKIEIITKEVSREAEIKRKKANEPLNIGIKISTFLFPLILTIILSGYYKSDGYDKKAKDLVLWTFLGICFYIIFGIVAASF